MHAAWHRHRWRLDHGQPRPGLCPGYPDRRPVRGGAGGGCVFCRQPAAQSVSPAVWRRGVQRGFRAGVFGPAGARGAGQCTGLRRGNAVGDGVLAVDPDLAGLDSGSFDCAEDFPAVRFVAPMPVAASWFLVPPPPVDWCRRDHPPNRSCPCRGKCWCRAFRRRHLCSCR